MLWSIFQFSFVNSRVYSIDSSKMMSNFPEVLNFNRFVLNSFAGSTIRENRQLVTDEPVEFEK